MPGPESRRPGIDIELENRVKRYFDRLQGHFEKLNLVASGRSLPAGETLKDNYNQFLELANKIFDVYRRDSKSGQKLLDLWNKVDEMYSRRFAEAPKSASAATIDSAKSTEKDAFTPRNPFEEFLFAYRFPREKLGKYDPETLQYMRSFIFTHAAKYVVRQVNWNDEIIKPLMRVEFATASTKFTMIQLVEQSTNNLTDLAEVRAREDLKKEMSTDFSLIDNIFHFSGQIKKLNAGGAGVEELQKLYNEADLKQIFDKDAIKKFNNLPTLLGTEGGKEKISLSEAFLQAYKEIKNSGKEWDKDSHPEGWIRPRKVLSPPLNAYDLNPAVFKNESPHHSHGHEPSTIQIIQESIPETLKDKSVAPEMEAGAYSALKERANNRLRALAAKADTGAYVSLGSKSLEDFADRTKHPFTTQGDMATLLAKAFARIAGELDEMDNVAFKPVGKNKLSQAIHGTAYANKKVSESGQERVNPYIAGRVLSFVRPFGKYAIMDDGKTFEQAVMSADSWDDLKIEGWSSTIAYNWTDQVIKGLGLFKFADQGLSKGRLFGVAKMNLEEGRLVIDDKIVEELTNIITGDLRKYHFQRDMGTEWHEADKASKLMSRYKKYVSGDKINPEYEARRTPSEEFTVITVVTHDAMLDPKTGEFIPDEKLTRMGISPQQQEEMKVNRIITRFPQQYFTTIKRLGRWVDDRGKANSGDLPWDKSSRNITRRVKEYVNEKGKRVLKETGQIDEEMIIVLPKGVELVNKEKRIDNTADTLVMRLLFEYYMEMFSMQGDMMAHLSKEDYLPLGMFCSREIRENYKKNKYNKISDRVKAQLDPILSRILNREVEFFSKEDPRIRGIDLLTEDQYFKLLHRMGHRITIHDWQSAGSFFFGRSPDKGHGKH